MQKRRTRRRYGRVSRSGLGRARSPWIGILISIGIAGYTALAGLLGVYLADKVFLPMNVGVLGGSASSVTTLPPLETVAPVKTPAKTSEPPAKVNVIKDVVFPRLDFFALQIGAYSTEDAAVTAAEVSSARGGAGYIVYDVRYRVLLSLYLSENDARSVKDSLAANEKIDSYIYSGSIPMVELTITSSQSQIDAITSGYASWHEALELMRSVSDLVDTGGMTPEDARGALFEKQAALQSAFDRLSTNASIDDESGVLDGLRMLLQKMLTKTAVFCEENTLEGIAFSAAIKYNYIEAVFEYKEYIETISGSFT